MTIKTSRAAKAAAIMAYTAGVPDYETALKIFDTLGASDTLPVDAVLEKFNAVRWAALDHISADEWWEEVELLSHTIDDARKELA